MVYKIGNTEDVKRLSKAFTPTFIIEPTYVGYGHNKGYPFGDYKL